MKVGVNRSRPRPSLLVIARPAAALLALALSLGAGACQEDPEAWRKDLAAWKHPAPLPAFPLIDSAGRAFTLRELKGQPLVVAFVYTRCPIADQCPLTMARLKQVQVLSKGTGLRFLVVTLDPEHDTPKRLDEYARLHAVDVPGFTIATGSKEVVDAMTSLFNVIAVRASPELINHNVKLAVVDDKLVPRREWLENNFYPKEIVDAAVGE
jgi:protein SCO1